MNLKSYMRGLGLGIIVTAILMGIGNNKAERVTVAEENNATVLSDLKELSEEASSSSSSVKKQQDLDEKMDEAKVDDAISMDEISDNNADTVSNNADDVKIISPQNNSANKEKNASKSINDNKEIVADDKNVTSDNGGESDKIKVSTVLPKAGQIADDGQAPRDDKKKTDTKENTTKTESTKTDIAKAEESKVDTGKENNTNNNADSKKAAVGEIIDITIVSGQGSDAIARECERLGLVEEASAFDKFLNSYGYDRKLTTGVHHIPMGSTEAQIAEILTKKGE